MFEHRRCILVCVCVSYSQQHIITSTSSSVPSMTDFLLSVTLACHCVWGVSAPKVYYHSLRERERESSANSLTCGVQRNCASDCHRGTLLITCHLSRLSVGLPSYANSGAYQSKGMKVKKNAITVLGQNALCKFTGQSSLYIYIYIYIYISSNKMTHKQQLNGEKWDVELGHLSAFGWAVLFSCPVLGTMLAWQLHVIGVMSFLELSSVGLLICKKKIWQAGETGAPSCLKTA